MIPIAGSAYTYAYAILGEIFAWIIGWDLILEYAVANMAVAVGFSAYLQDLIDNVFGFHLPPAIAYPMFPGAGATGGIFNLPALLITLAVTWVLVRGVRESARDQHHHGDHQDRSDPDLLLRRRARDQHRELASLRAQRIFGRPDRRVDRLLHLHRLRLRLDRRRGVQEAAARPALRHHGHAGHLHDSLRRASRWC